MMQNKPSQKSLDILASLKKTALSTLDKKEKLGHYAVIWENNKIVYKGLDAPKAG